MIRFSIALFFSLFSLISYSQEFTWLESTSSALDFDKMNDIAKSPDSAFVMVGSYRITSLTIGDTTLTGSGPNSSFVAKFATDGTALWAKKLGGSGPAPGVNAKSVTVDPITGDIYVLGYSAGYMSIDFVSYGGFDKEGFLLKLSPSGNIKWLKFFTTPFSSWVRADDIVIDEDHNLTCAGRFGGSLVYDTDTLSTQFGTYSTSFFATRVDSAGNLIYHEAIHSGSLSFSNDDLHVSIGTLSDKSTVMGGVFQTSIALPQDTILATSGFSRDIFLAKLDSTGQGEWITRFGSSGNESVGDLLVDTNDNIHFTGAATVATNFDSFTPSGTIFFTAYLASADSSGAIYNLTNATTGSSEGMRIGLDEDYNIYITGSHYNTITLGGFTLPVFGGTSQKLFIAKYDLNTSSWEYGVNSDNATNGIFENASGLAVLAEDDLIVGGEFESNITLNGLGQSSTGIDLFYGRLLNCNGLSTSLSAPSSGGTQCLSGPTVLEASYHPTYSYSLIAGQTDSSFTALFPGSYFAIVDSSGCKDTTQIVTIDTSNALNVSLNAFSGICENASPLTLTGGTPAGGTYSGVGVTGNTFNPSIAGVGSVPITYTYTDPVSGCTDSTTQNIQVSAVPFIFMNTLDTNCTNSAPITLNVGLPAGGVYSGVGVSGNTFDPSQAAVGSNTIYYTRTNAGCSATDSAIIELVTPPVVSFMLDSVICNNAAPVALTATPAGGTFSGNGIAGNFLVPQLLSPGNEIISYSVTENGCSTTVSDTIQVDTDLNASLSAIPSFCLNDQAMALTSFASPANGVFSGNGVSGNSFDPAVAGVGVHVISYIVSNSCGSDTATQSVEVNGLPTVNFPALGSICVNNSPLGLNTATPAGGNYTGTGVSGSTFNPASAGVGNFNLTYTYTDTNGCVAAANSSVTVNGLPAVSLDTLGGICDNRPAFTLNNGTPAGGTYSGNGVVGNQFDPGLVTVGDYDLSYAFTDANGCTNTDTINVAVRITFNDTLVHVACDSFTTSLGTTYYTSGVYVDSLLSLGNCDSVIVRDVTIHPSTVDTLTPIVCNSYTSVTNQVYTSSGVYFDTLTSIHGCDSIIRTELTVIPAVTASIAPVACDQYTAPSGALYAQSGTYIDSLTSSTGCDSILTINLTINNSVVDTLTTSACDSYSSPGGQVLTSTGMYADSFLTVNGCDSILMIDLTILESSVDSNQAVSCVSYTSAGGLVYTASGTYTENYSKVNGCDSTVVEEVVILDATASSVSPVVCDSYLSPSGKTFTSTGLYSDTLINAAGCDSIISINLQVNQSSLDSVIVTAACDSFYNAVGDYWIYTTGVYTDSLTSVHGCDSVWMTFINVNYTSANLFPVTACDSFVFAGVGTFYTSQIVYDTVPGINGCDYITGYDITIVNSVSQTLPVIACDSFVSPSGMSYTANGVYPEVYTAANGCDSTVNYDVTLIFSVQQTVAAVSCDSFTSPAGITYMASGVYPEVFAAANGCDSTVNYDVTINLSTQQTVTVAACDSFMSPSGVSYTASGMYPEMYTTVNGCDSIVNYDLTLNFADQETVMVEACDSYTSPFGVLYTASGQYTELTSTIAGCDSTITYDVTIRSSETTLVQDTSCGSYQTPLGQLITASGTYVDSATTIHGCDSIITYDITIGQDYLNAVDVTSCDPFLSAWGVTYATSGSYVDSSISVLGCDSISVLNLTISEAEAGVIQSTDELTAEADSSTHTFRWFSCTDSTLTFTGITSATFIPTVDGEYALEATNQDSCVDTSACISFTRVGVADIDQPKLNLFPNPTQGRFVLTAKSLKGKTAIHVISATGALVYQRELGVLAADWQEEIDLGTVGNGMYIIVITNKDQVYRKQLMINK